MQALVTVVRIPVVVTTRGTTQEPSIALLSVLDFFSDPRFQIVVVCPKGSLLILQGSNVEVMHYAKAIKGLRAIRLWIEQTFKSNFFISDDDILKFFQMTLNAANLCGVSRNNLKPALVYNACLKLLTDGEKVGAAYVGFNASEASLTVNRKRTFTPYLEYGYQKDAVITGLQGVIIPCREKVPESCRGVGQEFSVSCLTAIRLGHGTLQNMTVVASFDVNPPATAKEDFSTLLKEFPSIMMTGNSAQAKEGRKTGCIIKTKTARKYAQLDSVPYAVLP